MTACSDGAATAASSGSGGILALSAALAVSAKLVEPGADVPNLEPIEPLGAETGDEI